MEISMILLEILIIIIAAKAGGEIARRLKQPEVLGELIVGVVIGYSAIIHGQEDLIVIETLAELGIILLLFHVGLDSNINELMKMGKTSLLVACIGIAVPFILGYAISFWLFGDQIISLLIGATLTATSITIPAMVLTDIGKLTSDESKVILGAAVLDDIIGLLILAMIVPLLNAEKLSFFQISQTVLIAIGFLVGSLIVGIKVAPFIIKYLGRMKSSGITVVAAFAFSLSLAFIADFLGLATVVGGFFAGLILAQSKNRDDIYQKITPLTEVFTPVFFVMMGTLVSVEMLSLDTLKIAFLIAFVAILGKMFSGFGAIRTKLNKLTIGAGMVARGEIALISISFGLSEKGGGIIGGIYENILVCKNPNTIGHLYHGHVSERN